MLNFGGISDQSVYWRCWDIWWWEFEKRRNWKFDVGPKVVKFRISFMKRFQQCAKVVPNLMQKLYGLSKPLKFDDEKRGNWKFDVGSEAVNSEFPSWKI